MEKYGMPALASFFFPGVGQIIKGEVWKGIGIMGLYAVSVGLCFLAIGFLTTPILHIWQVYDAYNAEV